MVCVVPKGEAKELHALLPLLASELNVKEIVFASSADDFVTLEARANFRVLGKKFGKETPLAAAAIATLPSEALHRFEHGEPLGVTVGNETHTLDADDLTIVRRASGDLVVKEEGGYFAAIDPTLTPELRREGVARELVSRVQRLRKELGFAVSDRIRLAVFGDDEVRDAVTALKDWIAGEVLARDVHIAPIATDQAASHDAAASVSQDTVQGGLSVGHVTHRLDLDGLVVGVALTRIE
jgi:isoleucyl-tRNA synthetase